MNESWKLKRTAQCKLCPWRKDVNPREIPDGYSEEKHRALKSTIAEEDDLSFLNGFLSSSELKVMACHETGDTHCIGWLVNQMGVGNNIGLRLHMRSCENANTIKLLGEQHETFGDTLPLPARGPGAISGA